MRRFFFYVFIALAIACSVVFVIAGTVFNVQFKIRINQIKWLKIITHNNKPISKPTLALNAILQFYPSWNFYKGQISRIPFYKSGSVIIKYWIRHPCTSYSIFLKVKTFVTIKPFNKLKPTDSKSPGRWSYLSPTSLLRYKVNKDYYIQACKVYETRRPKLILTIPDSWKLYCLVY